MLILRTSNLFTIFIGLSLLAALIIAWDWPLRASIIVLVLGSIGLVLVTVQLFIDLIRRHGEEPPGKLDFEIPSFEAADPRATRQGTLEIWGWLLGLLIAIRIIGLPVSLPLFVFAYAKVYGANWTISGVLGALIAGFEYGVYQRIMHVYWPEALILKLFA